MSRSLKRMGKSVGRCNKNAIAKHAVSDKRICNKMVKLLGRKVEKEMKEMCLLSTDSALRNKDLESFDLEHVYEELEARAPITKSMLLSCLAGHRKSSATEIKKKGRTKCRMADSATVIGVCCCILLRARSQRMNALQRMVSLILYCGHASKRVSFMKYLNTTILYGCICIP